MDNLLFSVAVLIGIVYIFIKINSNIHMLQLNSYRNKRYLKWVSRNLSKLFKIRDIVPMLTIIFIINKKYTIGYVLWIICYVLLISFRDKSKQKLKLVYTARVKRLFISLFLIALVALICIFALYDGKNSVGYMFVVMFTLGVANLLTFIIVLLGNTIMKPVEALVNRYYYNDAYKLIKSAKSLKIVGITGSYGKTSTKHTINKVLSKKFNVLITPESYNTTMGVIKTIRMYLKPTHEVFIVEMGAKNIGDIKEICDLVSPHYGVLTSVGPQHLESFKTIENVAKTKHELLEAVPQNGIAFENGDDENIKNYPKTPGKKYILYGIDEKDLHYKAENIRFSSRGSSFTVVKYDGSREDFTTKLLGKHNIYNILAAIAIGSELGMKLSEMHTAVKDLEPVEHRLELKRMPNGMIMVDDAFNSNPVGSKMALEVLGQMEGGKKILITPGMIELGSMEYELNKAFGAHAAKVCDYIILVGKKQTVPIKAGIDEQKYPASKVYIAANLNEALQHLNTFVAEGDMVLFENDLPDDYNE